MVRLIVNLLLITGLLLTQFAAVPHAHAAGSSGTAHEGQPHFHFHLFGPNDSAEPRACRESGCTEHDRAEPALPWDHDADAVYVESTTAAPEREKHFAPESLAEPTLVWPPLLQDTHSPVTTQTDDRARPSSNCPLYVRFLTLTI